MPVRPSPHFIKKINGLGLMHEAKNYAKWELEHQAMKHILPESLGGKSSHHHSHEVASSGGMGSGGSSGGIAGMLGK